MKIFTGKVVSKNMQKTATVAVRRVVAHPIYKKRIRKVKKYHIHDEIGSEVGQVVKFVASKPYSKLKKWKVIEVVGGKVVDRKSANTEDTEKKSENTEKKRKSARRKRRGAKK